MWHACQHLFVDKDALFFTMAARKQHLKSAIGIHWMVSWPIGGVNWFVQCVACKQPALQNERHCVSTFKALDFGFWQLSSISWNHTQAWFKLLAICSVLAVFAMRCCFLSVKSQALEEVHQTLHCHMPTADSSAGCHHQCSNSFSIKVNPNQLSFHLSEFSGSTSCCTNRRTQKWKCCAKAKWWSFACFCVQTFELLEKPRWFAKLGFTLGMKHLHTLENQKFGICLYFTHWVLCIGFLCFGLASCTYKNSVTWWTSAFCGF